MKKLNDTHLRCNNGHILDGLPVEGVCPTCWKEGQVTEQDLTMGKAVDEYFVEERKNTHIKSSLANILPFDIDDCYVDGYTITIPNTEAGSDGCLFLNAEDFLGDLNQYTHEEIIKQFVPNIIHSLDALDLLEDEQVEPFL